MGSEIAVSRWYPIGTARLGQIPMGVFALGNSNKNNLYYPEDMYIMPKKYEIVDITSSTEKDVYIEETV